MCSFELMTYPCQHHVFRRCSYCHFARNDEDHACRGVKVLKRTRQDSSDCDACQNANKQPSSTDTGQTGYETIGTESNFSAAKPMQWLEDRFWRSSVRMANNELASIAGYVFSLLTVLRYSAIIQKKCILCAQRLEICRLIIAFYPYILLRRWLGPDAY